jgi:hypothetical protein
MCEVAGIECDLQLAVGHFLRGHAQGEDCATTVNFTHSNKVVFPQVDTVITRLNLDDKILDAEAGKTLGIALGASLKVFLQSRYTFTD